MDEHVVGAIVNLNEAEAFLAIEEFNDALAFADYLGRHGGAALCTTAKTATAKATASTTETAAATRTAKAAAGAFTAAPDFTGE
jgi:hypothetical protein